MSPEDAARLKELMREAEEILSRNTDLSQLKDLDDVELETRRRIHEYVAPELMAFLLPRVAGPESRPRHSSRQQTLPRNSLRTLQTTLGKLKLNSRQARKLGVDSHRQFSPLLEKFALVAAAKTSFAQAERDLAFLCGFRISDSTLQRLVQRASIPVLAASSSTCSPSVHHLSVDGGKVRLATGTPEPGTVWRDYKALALNGGLPGQEQHATLHDPITLAQRVRGRPGVEEASFIGDGHPGIWNLMRTFRSSQDASLQPGVEILDWYHLKENVHKHRWSKARKERICNLLWQGQVEEVLTREVPPSHRLHKYLTRHRHRIVNYKQRHDNGQIIGSGAVESAVKQIDARLQLPGAWWEPKSVNRMLDLRNAYINGWLFTLQ
jgi:hypothetical protein